MKASRVLTVLCSSALAVAFGAGAAHAELKKQRVDYKEGNTALSGYLVYDDAFSGKRPGVLMAHSRAGMAEEIMNDSDMVAKMGYVVFAEDIFGKGVVPKDVPEMQAQTVIYNKDRPLMRARSVAGFDVLKANPMVDPTKLAIVGYCFGGTVAVELAETGVPVAGIVSVHGSFRDFQPERAKNIKGRVLILHGAEDPVAPLAEVNLLVDQLRAAKVKWESKSTAARSTPSPTRRTPMNSGPTANTRPHCRASSRKSSTASNLSKSRDVDGAGAKTPASPFPAELHCGPGLARAPSSAISHLSHRSGMRSIGIASLFGA